MVGNPTMQDLSFGDNPPKDWRKAKTNTRRVAKRAGITTPLKDIPVLLTDLIVDSIAKALQTQAGNGKGNGRGNGKGSGKGNDRGNGKGNGKGNDRVQDNDNSHGNGRDNGRGTASTVHKAPESVRWKNPANRVLKLAMQMLESDDSDVNESHLYVSRTPTHCCPHAQSSALPIFRLPRRCRIRDPKLLLHPPGCLVFIELPKEHRLVKDSSNGPRGLEGLFFGCHPISPLARVWVPSLQRFVLSKNCEIYDTLFPYKERCMHNLTGFTKQEIQAMAPSQQPLAVFTEPTIIQATPRQINAVPDACQPRR